MKEYKAGDRVWCSSFGNKKVTKKCPVCFGKKRVTLILGDETYVEMDCDYCSRGYLSPTGHIEEYEYIAEAILKTIDTVSMKETIGGFDIQYTMLGGYTFDQCDVFDNEDDAYSLALEKASKYQQEETERSLRRKNNAQTVRTYSWGAGYHMTEAKRCEKQAERHRNLARICKERSKQGEK